MGLSLVQTRKLQSKVQKWLKDLLGVFVCFFQRFSNVFQYFSSFVFVGTAFHWPTSTMVYEGLHHSSRGAKWLYHFVCRNLMCGNLFYETLSSNYDLHFFACGKSFGCTRAAAWSKQQRTLVPFTAGECICRRLAGGWANFEGSCHESSCRQWYSIKPN